MTMITTGLHRIESTRNLCVPDSSLSPMSAVVFPFCGHVTIFCITSDLQFASEMLVGRVHGCGRFNGSAFHPTENSLSATDEEK